MKKVVLAIAVIAVMGAFASCSKKCSCTTYVGGFSTKSEVDLDKMESQFGVKVNKCSDLNSVVTVEGVKMGTECK